MEEYHIWPGSGLNAPGNTRKEMCLIQMRISNFPKLIYIPDLNTF